MSTALADYLGAARRRAFIGRREELAVVEALLDRPDTGAIVYLHGPGGVGKSTLLRQIGWLGERAGRRVERRDGRDVAPPAPPTPTRGPALLLLVDAAEALGPPDHWLTEDFLAGLAAEAIVVVAGREPPPLAWRTDPGWRALVRVLELGNFSQVEGAELLATLGVPEERQAAVLSYTRGHPLALAIASDVCVLDDGRPGLAAAPQVVAALLAGLLDAVPGPGHRAALEACAQVRVTTEPLLAALMDRPEARELFDWLRGLSVVECGPRGVFPHGLARDALTAELQWRDPDRYAEIHRRAGAYYRSQFRTADAHAQQAVLADLAYLHRDSPTLGPFLQPLSAGVAPAGGLRVRPGADRDHAAVLALIRRHEGAGSARIAEHWLRRQPCALAVVQSPAGEIVGCCVQLVLDRLSTTDRAVDPAIDRAAAHLTGGTPLRAGEAVSMVRFWLSADEYQDLSPVSAAITLHAIRQYLTTPGLAVSLVAHADPEFWSAATAYLDFARLPAADFEVDGRRSAVFGHDWRLVPAPAWLDLLAARETAAAPLDMAAVTTPPDLRVLDIDEFALGVRAALRDLGRPDRLASCALARSRMVAERGADGPAGRGAAVQALIIEAASALADSPRDRRAHRAVHHTYLQPAGSQQRAAELLDLPMTTFRRHLAAGVDRIVELLWQRELTH